MPVEIEDTARDIWPLLDKLFQDARNKVQIRMALLPVGTVYARYSNANILLFECLFKVVYDDRSERNPKSALFGPKIQRSEPCQKVAALFILKPRLLAYQNTLAAIQSRKELKFAIFKVLTVL